MIGFPLFKGPVSNRTGSFLLLCIVALASGLSGFAQEYQPRETWPFLYEEFRPGAARTRDGALTERDYNIAVHDGTLMFVNDEKVIMRADMTRIFSARVGDDVYVNIGGRMYRLLSELDCGNVVLGSEIDVDQQSKVSIGYGISSSTASAQGVSLLMDGRFDAVNKSLQQTELDKYRGEVLPVKQVRYLQIGLRLIPATRQGILGLPGIDKKAASAFFKQEKIKWTETSSLEKVLVFVSGALDK